MRQIAFTNKKVRGIPRRLRALKRWAESFEGWFPDDITREESWRSIRLPIINTMVVGKQTNESIQSECAQRMIDACSHLINAKPDKFKDYKIVARISLPNMWWNSEVCVFSSMEYYRDYFWLGTVRHGCDRTLIEGQVSLAKRWSLILPQVFKELGVHCEYHKNYDPSDWYISDHWYYGEFK